MAKVQFIDAAVPEPTVLLGRTLKPLSIGHCLLLERFDCQPVDSPESLVFAVVVCSHDPKDVLKVLEDPLYKLKLRLWRWRIGEVDWAEKLKIWGEYFAKHTEAPSVVSTHESSEPKTSGTPFLLHLKVYLQSKLGYSNADALNCPVSQGIWEMYAHAEIEGNLEIVDIEGIEAAHDWVEQNKDDLIKLHEENLKASEKREKEMFGNAS